MSLGVVFNSLFFDSLISLTILSYSSSILGFNSLFFDSLISLTILSYSSSILGGVCDGMRASARDDGWDVRISRRGGTSSREFSIAFAISCSSFESLREFSTAFSSAARSASLASTGRFFAFSKPCSSFDGGDAFDHEDWGISLFLIFSRFESNIPFVFAILLFKK